MKTIAPFVLLLWLAFSVRAQDTTTYYAGKARPNVFTPNNDGFNDVFRIPGLSPGDEILIFNRYGTLLYKFSGPNDHWDGRNTSGIAMVAGVYFYTISTPSGKANGFIQLIR